MTYDAYKLAGPYEGEREDGDGDEFLCSCGVWLDRESAREHDCRDAEGEPGAIIHGSPEWYEARKRLLTASDAPLLFNEGWAKTEDERKQQRAVLRTLKAFGEEIEEAPPEHMAVARCLEAGVIEYLRDELKWKVRRNRRLYIDRECPLLGATVDAVRTLDDGTEWDVEIKVSGSAAQEDCKVGGQAACVNGAPVYWCIQNQAQMAVSGRPHGCIVVCHHADRHGLKIREYQNPRNELLVRRIRAETVAFWQEVERLRKGQVA